MRAKKWIATLCLLALLFPLVSCQSGNQTANSPTQAPAEATKAPDTKTDEGTGDAAATDAPAASSEKDYSKKITLTVNYTDADKKGEDELYKFLCEKFNVDIQFIPMQFNERNDKARIWVSTNDMPDLLWLDLDEKLFAEYSNWVNQGMFVPYPDDIRERWPNIGKVFNREDMVGDELMTIGGKLYAFPTIRNNPQYNYMSAMSWVYRKDWAEKLGIAKADDIYTWDEFIDMNRQFIEKDPGGNGAGKTVGFGTQIFYFPNHAGVWQLSGEYGYGAFEPIDGKYEWTSARPETLEGLLIAKKLYDEKIIWNDNALGESAEDKYRAGLMGVMFDNMDIGRTKSNADVLKETFPDIDVEKALANCFVKGPNGDFWAKQSQCYWGAVVLSPSMDEEKLERFLDIADWLNNDTDGYGYVNYGLEGKDYNIKEDGTFECLWPVDPATGLQKDPYPSGCRFNLYTNPGDAFNSVATSVPQWIKDTVNAKFKFNTENALLRKFDYESSYFSAPNKDKSGNFVTETQDKMIELITTSSYDKLTDEWNAWLKTMEPKVQPVLDELNAGITNIPK